jgi:hypothetical protein
MLLFAGLMFFMAFFAPPPARAEAPSPVPLKPVMIVMAVMFLLLSAWGISTAVAIFLRRRWARISILVFAVLLTFMSAGGMLMILFVPLPAAPEGNPAATTMVRFGLATVYGAFTAIGVWWLVLFNRRGANEYFEGREPVSEGARPMSVTLIAWYLLLGAAITAVAAILRSPAALFGVVITGWVAPAIYAVLAAVQIYLGTGLLHLQEEARIGAIAYFCFGVANSAVSLLRPGYVEMIRQVQAAMPRFFPAGAPSDIYGTMRFFGLATAVIIAVPIYFLVRRRSAFH